MAKSTELYKRLRDEVDGIQVVDTHEHIYMPEEDYLTLKVDFTRFFLHYTSSDLVSAGMDIDDMDRMRLAMGRPQTPSAARQRAAMGRTPLSSSEELTVEEKWEQIQPFWIRARNTAYCKAVRRSIR